jgi:hypothetical protein
VSRPHKITAVTVEAITLLRQQHCLLLAWQMPVAFIMSMKTPTLITIMAPYIVPAWHLQLHIDQVIKQGRLLHQ